MSVIVDNPDEGGQRPTIIYLPSEIEWFADSSTWMLDIEKQHISKCDGSHFTEKELHNAVAQLTIEMLAQLESLAAYVDDLETQMGDNDLRDMHGDGDPKVDRVNPSIGTGWSQPSKPGGYSQLVRSDSSPK